MKSIWATVGLSVVAFVTLQIPSRCFSQITLNSDFQVASLQERYRHGSIYINSGTLNSFRSHLHNGLKRQALDSMTHPIPMACKVLQLYLDSRYMEILRPGWGISILIVDFQAGRAFNKSEVDTTGSVTELEWTRTEVLAVAELVDKLLYGTGIFRDLALKIGMEPGSIVEAWQKVTSSQANPYATTDSVAKYLKFLKEASDKNPELVEKVKLVDPKTYAQVSTFIDNANQIEIASVRSGTVARGSKSNIWSWGQDDFVLSGSKSSASVLVDQAASAKDLIKLTPEQAATTAKELQELQPSYWANMPKRPKGIFFPS